MLSFFLCGCASVQRNALLSKNNWHAETIQTDSFPLQAFISNTIISKEPLTVVIEGDGFAWVSRSVPSVDPTPTKPTALNIAMTQNNAVYLGRPCQYLMSESCSPLYWTRGRFDEKVLQSMSEALDILKKRTNTTQLNLMGYSGGGVIAGFLAATRDDVIRWITVASPIDVQAWTAFHQVTAVSFDLNTYIPALKHIPQTHYRGGRDAVVPELLHQFWEEEMQGIQIIQWVTLPGHTHLGPWVIKPLMF